jgi:hypothetical protein
VTSRHIDRKTFRDTCDSFVVLSYTLAGIPRRDTFFVSSIGAQAMILGMPWLEKVNPLIDWIAKTMEPRCHGRALYVWFLVTGRSQRCGLDWSCHDVCCELGKMGLDGRRYISNVAVTGPSPTIVTVSPPSIPELLRGRCAQSAG